MTTKTSDAGHAVICTEAALSAYLAEHGIIEPGEPRDMRMCKEAVIEMRAQSASTFLAACHGL